MKACLLPIAACAALVAPAARAGPDLECDGASQVEISACVRNTLEQVDRAVETAFGYAMDAAAELDGITGRDSAVPALRAGQDAWRAYRDAHCDYVGATYGGGSGTGIAISSCRVMLGRDRVETLLRFAG